MKLNNYLSILCVIIIMFFSASCKKEVIKKEEIISGSGVAVFPNFAEILLNKAEYIERLLSKNGYIGFSIYNPIGVKAGNPNIYATFTDSAGHKSYGNLFIGSYKLIYDKDIQAYDNTLDFSGGSYLKTLFGTNTVIQLKDKNGVDNEVQQEIYIPKALDVSSPISSPINRNATFTWNADNTNTLGVVIAVNFSPLTSGNQQFNGQKDITRIMIAQDNGSYTIDPLDLQGIPAGAYVSIGLARGNLAEIKGLKTGNNYLIYTRSSTGGSFKLN